MFVDKARHHEVSIRRILVLQFMVKLNAPRKVMRSFSGSVGAAMLVTPAKQQFEEPYEINGTATFPTKWPKTTVPEVIAIRVLLIEDMHLMRSALASLLSQEDGIDVVADLECDDKVLSIALQLHPDVIVMDIDLSGGRTPSSSCCYLPRCLRLCSRQHRWLRRPIAPSGAASNTGHRGSSRPIGGFRCT